MKPTPQTTSNQHSSRSERGLGLPGHNFPVVDCSYQMTAEAVEAPSAITENELADLPSFQSLSREVFGAKADHEYIREAIFFGSIACVAAWPVTVMLHQLATMMISPPPVGLW